jgi:hypothetical protein
VVGLQPFGYGRAERVDDLIRQLKDGNPAGRVNAALALGRSKDPRAVEALIAILNDKNDPIRGTAALALGRSKDPRAVEALIAILNDKNDPVRGTAAFELGMIKDPRAVEPLIAALMDKDPDVRILSTSALVMIGDPRAVESLTMALEDSNPTVRQEAASALAKIRSAQYICQPKKMGFHGVLCRAYSGAALPRDQVAVLERAGLGPIVVITAIDGQSASVCDHDPNAYKHRPTCYYPDVVELLPGHHSMTFWPEFNKSNGALTVEFDAAAGRKYKAKSSSSAAPGAWGRWTVEIE